ncbi:hypothetical protein [Rhizobium sp. CRRU65]|uniref:hypothetical protein n=1 Tax=Rhizobium sp. CRRU65 TaxID=3399566 RepID=UPI003AF80429
MYLELVEVANDLEEYGLIDAERRRQLIAYFWEKQQDYSADDAVYYALQQSMCDVIRVVGSHGFDEEHITANLTGSLTANLSWFARTYRRWEGQETLPHFQWVHQTKHSEARSGIDLGILARIPGGDAVRAWRLLVVQAKLGEPDALKISVDHITNSTRKVPLTPAALQIFRAAAHATGDFVLTKELYDTHTAACVPFETGDVRYQLEAILRTDLRGRKLANSNRNWCFYAGWFPASLPLAVDVRTLAGDCVARFNDRPREHWFKKDALDFTNLMHETIFAEETPYGLVLSEEQVGEVVDDLLVTAPDIRLLLASADGELDYNLGTKKRLLVSGSLIPLQLVHPTVAPPTVSTTIDPSDSSTDTTLGY